MSEPGLRHQARSQLARGLQLLDDPWGVTWRSWNLLRRISLRRCWRFTLGFVTGVTHQRPLFIIGASRSGTTLFFRLLKQHSQLGALPREGHDLWRTFHHPRSRGWSSDRVGAGELRRGEKRYVDAYLYSFFSHRRFVEKTPENAFRVPYLLELFPDARFLVVKRNPCDVINSLIQGWRDPSGRFRSYFVPEDLSIPGYPRRRQWCFALIEGWRQFKSAPIPEIAYAQWLQYVTALSEARPRVPKERWMEIPLEAILSRPREVLEELCTRFELEAEPALSHRLDELVREPVNALSPPGQHKWRVDNSREIRALLPRICEAAVQTGYRIDPASGDFEILSTGV
ncbi:MAG: sulfotransferase [Acidobacteriota bacterium]